MRTNPDIPNSAPVMECPNCDSTSITTELTEHRFKYGIGDDAVELACTLPLRVCEECGTEFMDDAGEMARHEAVCQHLGLITPAEILTLREQYGTQEEFRDLTGFGEASLSRWENGASLQTRTMDNYLFLLMFPENVQRLRDRMNARKNEQGQDRTHSANPPEKIDSRPSARLAHETAGSETRFCRFRHIERTPAQLKRQRAFKLRIAA